VTAARIETRGRGRFAVSGELSFATVPALWTQSHAAFAGDSEAIDIDLSDVRRADSAGLALLVAWMRQARRAEKTVRFSHPPQQLLALAKANRLEPVLGLQSAHLAD
jgi:phospholipid transport system transporter-binding protein